MLVIKIGGGAEINHRAVFENLAARLETGERCVVVHGANAEMDNLCERLDQPVRTLTSVSGYESRYTDSATMDAFKMAYCGKVNKTLVELCQSLGINAVGLSGVDGRLLTGRRKQALRVVEDGRRCIIRDDLSGRIEQVNTDLLHLLLEHRYLPLICPPALSEESAAINVDGDRAAAMIAGALSADALLILSNVPGLLRDPADESTLITNLTRASLADNEHLAAGRMKKKMMGAAEALDFGIARVIFADGRIAQPIDAALAGGGTQIS